MQEAVCLCFQMIAILNDINVDPSYFRVFRDAFCDWSKRITTADLSTLTLPIRRGLEGLSDKLDLSTGMSVNLLWESLRPKLPATQEHWNVYSRLLEAYKELENKVRFQIGKVDSSAAANRKKILMTS